MPSASQSETARALCWRAFMRLRSLFFLFYSNLLMGELQSACAGKSLAFALNGHLHDHNLAIALISALIGYVVFEYLPPEVLAAPVALLMRTRNRMGFRRRYRLAPASLTASAALPYAASGYAQ